MIDEEKSRDELLEELRALRQENRRLKSQIGIPTPPVKKNRTILVVDDNRDTRELVAEMVEELGFNAIAVPTSQEALTVFNQSPDTIDLIISDIVMPDGDGIHLLQEISKSTKPVKVIFMSGYAGDEIVHDAVYRIQDSDAVFIQKPFTLTELEPVILSQFKDPHSQG